jgi:exonuclease SbcC
VVDHLAVDAARATWSTASARVATCTEAIAALRGVLGRHARTAVSVLQSGLEDAEVALKLASRAADELATSRVDLDERMALHAAVDAAERTAGKALAGLCEAATRQRGEADRLSLAATDIVPDALEIATWTVQQLQTAAASLPSLAESATIATTQQHEAHRALAEALAHSGHPTVQSAIAVVIAEAEETAAAQRVSRWRDDLAATTERVRTLEEQGVPAARPEVTAVKELARRAATEAAIAAQVFTTAENSLAAAARALDDADAVVAGSAELRRRRDDARIVFRTCNGEAGMRVKLERWVLAGELDRVTDAANAHLARMTNHRYRLHRNSGSKGGLTLEVFDAHTGRARATASLSGGEQFQASLSLALGLADVVSHGGTASGKQFEALFVDEGFGSLDPDALDDAINALTQLQAAGRMVGAITHVEAMQQQLHVGIEVRSLPDGRGSTLSVHP